MHTTIKSTITGSTAQGLVTHLTFNICVFHNQYTWISHYHRLIHTDGNIVYDYSYTSM